MSIEKITIYSEASSITIDDGKVVALVQDYDTIEKVTAHIKEWIAMVRKYKEIGYFPLTEPEFIEDCIVTFTDLEPNKREVMRVNTFMQIEGFSGCNRIWQLPDELKVQVSALLKGFYLEYDTENWEGFTVTEL
ncbi:hypothetical protein SPBRAN_2007 [uncultured Candidatus Thioglobus sp.]|nr:hypothetical protein SPBRAN_2007 [uncultured Candidatus Thioglobus sp.]